jgi:hypothetical protein
MWKRLTKKSLLMGIIVFPILTFAATQKKEKILSTDILLDGKRVYRNYPKGDSSYKNWDNGAVRIDLYTDEEFGTLYEDKMKDSILFRKGTNVEHNYTEFWWFKLLSAKHSLHIGSRNVTISVKDSVEQLKNISSTLWSEYDGIIKKNEKKQEEVVLTILLLFHFYEDDVDFSEGLILFTVKNYIITKIVVNFMTEGDMP